MPIHYRETRRAEALRYFSTWRHAGAAFRVSPETVTRLSHGLVEVDFEMNLSTLAVLYVDRRRKALAPARIAGTDTGRAKCSRCGCTVNPRHEPASPDCDEARIERSISQSDWND